MSDKAMEKVTKKVTKKMDKMEKKMDTFGSMLDAVSGSIQDTLREAGFSSTDAKLTEIQTDVRKATVERRAEADRMAEQANRMAEQQQMATNRIIADTRETHDEVIGLRDDIAASASASKAAQVSTRAVASRAVLPLV